MKKSFLTKKHQKVNENIVISDPELAKQYQNGQNLLVQKNQLIVRLQDQINRIEKTKMDIEKEMNKISAESTKKQEETTNQQQEEEKDQQTVEVTGTPVDQQTSESILVKIQEDYSKGMNINQAIETAEDELIYLQSSYFTIENEEEADKLEEEIKHLQKKLTVLYQKQKQLEEGDNDPLIESTEEEEEEDDYIWNDKKHNDQKNSFSNYEEGIDEAEEDIDEAEEEPRYSGMTGPIEHNYELDKQGRPIKKIDRTKTPKSRIRAWSDAKHEKYDKLQDDINNLEAEIEDRKEEIKYEMEKFQTPSFEGVEGEMEQFWGELTHDEREVLNSGVFNNDKERIEGLKQAGAKNPNDILQSYYYYYPEFDKSLDKDRKNSEKEIKKFSEQIEKIKNKIQKKEKQLDDMGSPVYSWEVKGGRFIESHNPMSKDKFYDLSEAYAEIEDEESREDYLDEDFVFYVKINDNDNEFIGKIFKISPDGDWFGVVKKGKDKSFEMISYQPEYDEIDIVNFLGDNYDEVEIIDNHEFNAYIEGVNYDELYDPQDEPWKSRQPGDDDVEESWPSNTLASS